MKIDGPTPRQLCAADRKAFHDRMMANYGRINARPGDHARACIAMALSGALALAIWWLA